MKAGTAQQISNAILSCAAGLASFLFSLTALLYLTEFDQKILAALIAGAFCLLVSYVASERPNSESARALAALGERLLAVEDGDLVSPAPRRCAGRCRSWPPPSTRCSPKCARRSRMRMRSGCTIPSPRFQTGSISARRPTSS